MRTLFLLALSCLAGWVNAQFVTLEGRDFKLDGADFYPRVMNFSVLYARSDAVIGTPLPASIYLTTDASHGPTLGFDCTGESGCLGRLLLDLQKVRQMGFNTVRIVGNITPEYNDTPLLGPDERRFKISVGQNPFPGVDHDENRVKVDLEEDLSGPYADRHAQLIYDLLEVALQADLKVILLAGGNVTKWNSSLPERYMYPAFDQRAVDDYALLLEKLAIKLKDHPALLAYDLYNEPHYNGLQFKGCSDWDNNKCRDPLAVKWKKADICNITRTWFEAINMHDSKHLVTLGGLGRDELEQWDPAVLHIDFYSPHLYLTKDYRDVWDPIQAMRKYLLELHWMGQTCPMPWIIGETSFSANDRTSPQPHVGPTPDYHQMDYMNGTEAEQAAFVAESLIGARESGASGWSWWMFQEWRWYDQDANAYQDAGKMHGVYFGMLHLGDQNADWYDKPAVQVVQGYTPAPVPNPPGNEPPNYDNWNNLPGPVTFSGTVVDQFTDPIKEAQVWLRQESIDNPWVDPNEPPGSNGKEHFHPAATNESGQFTFGTEPPTTGYFPPVRSNLIVVGTGTNVLGVGGWFPGTVIEDNVTYLLTKDEFQYPGVVENESAMAVDYPSGNTFAGLQELRINNVETATNPNGWSADFVARQTVHATEFHAMNGTEVHLYTGPVFTDCDEGSYTMMAVNNNAASHATPKSNQQLAHSLQLQFAEPTAFQTTVFPNPFTDQLVVRVSNDAPVAAKLVDGLGKEIASWRFSNSKTIDLKDLAPGPYLLRIIQGNRSNSNLVIKQPRP